MAPGAGGPDCVGLGFSGKVVPTGWGVSKHIQRFSVFERRWPSGLVRWLPESARAPRAADDPRHLEGLLDAHRAQLVVDAWTLVPLLLVANLALWVTDPWVFSQVPEATSRMSAGRVQLLVLAVVGMGAIALWPRRVQEVAAAAGLGVTAIVAATLSELGPPSESWFQFIYPFVLSPLLCYLSPWARLGLNVAQGLTAVGVYFGANPAHLDDPLTWASHLHLVFLLAMSQVYGVRLDRGRRRTFAMTSALREERSRLRIRVGEKSEALQHMMDRFDEAVGADRVHLARELHDVSGQLLTAARYAMRLTVSRYKAVPLGIAPNLDQLRGLLDQLTDEMHSVCEHLRPQEIESLGLSAAIEAMVAGFQQRTGLTHTVRVPQMLPPLSQAVELAAYRCVQEALTNCAKHAHAQRVEVAVQLKEGSLVVEVSDDGVGLTDAGTRGFGLLGMQERAEAVRGSLEFSGKEGVGTTVRMKLPVEDAG